MNYSNYPEVFNTNMNAEPIKKTYFDINKFNAAFEMVGTGNPSPNLRPEDFVTDVPPQPRMDKPIPKNEFDEMLKARMEEHKAAGLTDYKKGKHTE